MKLALSTFFSLSIAPVIFAGSLVADPKSAHESTVFDRGRWEFQSVTGAMFSITGSSSRPTLNYWDSGYRLGIMLSDPSGQGFFRGNTEFVAQVFDGTVFDGPGNWLVGAGIHLRYNFIQPESRWVPFIQIGGGALYNDIYKDRTQRVIGQQWEFSLEASIGVRYVISPRWSASLEASYRHISNADLADRNQGVNSIGGLVGLGYHF